MCLGHIFMNAGIDDRTLIKIVQWVPTYLHWLLLSHQNFSKCSLFAKKSTENTKLKDTAWFSNVDILQKEMKINLKSIALSNRLTWEKLQTTDQDSIPKRKIHTRWEICEFYQEISVSFTDFKKDLHNVNR